MLPASASDALPRDTYFMYVVSMDGARGHHGVLMNDVMDSNGRWRWRLLFQPSVNASEAERLMRQLHQVSAALCSSTL